jgi:hypothetical protein
MTIDQAMRLLQYEIYRDLGIDWLNPNLLLQVYGNTALLGSEYQPPWQFMLSFWSESVDASMNALKAQQVGDVITLDPTVLYELAGDYEIIAKNVSHFLQEVEDATDGSFIVPPSRQGAMNNGTDEGSGILQLTLRTFNRSAAIFTDAQEAVNSSFATVPGQLPYAGTAVPSGAGYYVVSGELMLTTSAFPGAPYTEPPALVTDCNAAWTDVILDVLPGTIISAEAGSVLLSDNGSGDPWWFYISSGAAAITQVATMASSPPEIYVLAKWYGLPGWPPVGSTNEQSYPLAPMV